MQSYTMIFITVTALHVSGGSSAQHQELKTVYTASFWAPDDGQRNRLIHLQQS